MPLNPTRGQWLAYNDIIDEVISFDSRDVRDVNVGNFERVQNRDPEFRNSGRHRSPQTVQDRLDVVVERVVSGQAWGAKRSFVME